MELKPGQKFKWLELPTRWGDLDASDAPVNGQTYEVLNRDGKAWYKVKNVTTRDNRYFLHTLDDKFELVKETPMELKPGQKFKWLELPTRWNYVNNSGAPVAGQTYEVEKKDDGLHDWYDVKEVTIQGKYRLGTSEDKFELVNDEAWAIQDIGQGWLEAVRKTDSKRVISKCPMRLEHLMKNADDEPYADADEVDNEEEIKRRADAQEKQDEGIILRLDDELKEARAEVASMKEDPQWEPKLVENYRTAKDEIQRLKDSVRHLDEKNAELEKRNAALSGNCKEQVLFLRGHKDTIAELEADLKEHEDSTNWKKQEETIQSLMSKNKELKKKNEHLELAASDEYILKISVLERKNSEIEARRNELLHERDEIRAKNAELEKRMEREDRFHRERYNELQAEKKEYTGLLARYKISSQAQKNLLDKRAELENKNDFLENRNKGVSKQLTKAFEENQEINRDWFTLTNDWHLGNAQNNVDSARSAMEASTTAPKGRRIGMKKYLIMFTLGALTGGNIGNLADLGYAIRDHFVGSDTIVTGAFESLPTCNDCSNIFEASENVAICGKCGSQDIGTTIVAPLHRERGFPLTDVLVGSQFRTANGETKIVLIAGETITVEPEFFED